MSDPEDSIRIQARFPEAQSHAPAGFYGESDDDDYDDYDVPTPRFYPRPTVEAPKKIEIDGLRESERQRMRDTSLSGANITHLADESMYKTPNDYVLKNMTSFTSGDPVSVARQVRHLHNRVKLLEEELQTQHNRQIFLIGVVSVYIISRGIKWLTR